MILLSDLVPTNIQEEKEAFFADETYNPQFVYSEQIPAEELTSYGLPIAEHTSIAEQILEKTFSTYTPNDLQKMLGKKLSESEVHSSIETYLKLHHLDQKISISYSASYIARTSASATQLKVRLPVRYRRFGMQGVLNHEVGTHILRRVNYEQQPWYLKKKSYGFSEYLETEEGLAALHSKLPLQLHSAITQSLHYVAISKAQHATFAEVWETIKPFTDSPEQCWSLTFRAKRGILDTSHPGGFTKDLLYLDGMIRVWRWLQSHNFDITPLYFGKMAFADVDKALELNPDFSPQLPIFFTKNRSEYQKTMEKIGLHNGFAA